MARQILMSTLQNGTSTDVSSTFDAAILLIEDYKRKFRFNNKSYDLQTLVIDVNGGVIRYRMIPWSEAALDTLDSTTFEAALAAMKQSKATLLILGLKYNLRTIACSVV